LYIRGNRKERGQKNSVAKIQTKRTRKEWTTKANEEQPKKKEKDYTKLQILSRDVTDWVTDWAVTKLSLHAPP
jgi:hypothetical protein